MRVGDIEILPVLDGTARIKAPDAFRIGVEQGSGTLGGEAADWEPHRNLLDDEGCLTLAMGGFLIRGAGDRLILVDAGVGPIDRAPFVGGALIDGLAGLGHQPEDITDVVFTHLHFDHVGWATQKGRVVFSNATYRCDERDWDHFLGDDHHAGEAGSVRKLSPIADRLEPFDGSGPLFPGVDVLSAAGHTPGSTIVVISDGIERAMLLGDVVHCPVELLDDEWAGMSDVDPQLARRTRNNLARELEGTDTPVAAAHFEGMQFGRLIAAAGRRQWQIA